MKIIYFIIIVFSVVYTLWVNAKEAVTVINKKHSFSVRQTQEYTSLYYKNTIISEWKNEWFSCDKEWGYGQGDLINARVCISDELSLRNLWRNWYSFQILHKNYPGYYLYNTKSKIMYTHWSFNRLLQSDMWKNGLYYLFSVDTASPWNEDRPNEYILQFKNDGTYREIYNNTDQKSRLMSYELLPQKKIKLVFQTNNTTTIKIFVIK